MSDSTYGAMSTPKDQRDVLGILSPAALGTLKVGYDRSFLLGSAPKMIRYAKVIGHANWIADTVYGAKANPVSMAPGTQNTDTTTLTPVEREMVVLAVAATKRDAFTMAGHIYWALMEMVVDQTPDPVAKIADVMMTAGIYGGVDNLRWAITVLREVLLVLEGAAADGGVSATTLNIVTMTFPAHFPAW